MDTARGMKIVTTKADLRTDRARLPGRVGFVPTMGALHAGHVALADAARTACDSVVASIFVNPTQFGDPSDLAAYPSTLDADLEKLRAAGVDLVFTPDPAEIYPPGADTIVETPRLAGMLMGALRPGHFRGVATVVAKLFNLVQPDAAWFGLKDFQQVLVIRQMVRDLEMGLEIIGHPTVREADGLAMSSRNMRLSPEDRAAAAVLHRALEGARRDAAAGATGADVVDGAARIVAQEARASLRSLDLRCALTLDPIPMQAPLHAPAVLLIAAAFGPVLLIDNMVLDPPG